MRSMIVRATTFVMAAALLVLGMPGGASAAAPTSDPFYTYSGTTPLSQLKPGTVLKKRTVSYRIQGVPLPLSAIQILYRTENQLGDPVSNVTTVIRPLIPLSATPKVVSYQSFYDSLNPADEPSRAVSGGSGLGNGIVNAETGVIAPFLLAGYTVVVPDTEGQTADFAAGREYGVTTLDSLRAASLETSTGIGSASKIGMIGYSGGAIASEWAAELAPSYAPEVAKRIVGTAIGGVLVKPSTNLHYVEGSAVWAGVIPMALVGVARAFKIDLTPYLSDYGKQVNAKLQNASIATVLGAYPGLTWKQLAKPEYATPESVPAYVNAANQLIMGTGGTPNAPLFIGQGDRGELEGTPAGAAGIGPGDGVMVAGDVRSLARQYCGKGVPIQYQEYPLSHVTTAPAWLPQANAWLMARFGGVAAPNNCSSIAPGNSLSAIPTS
ncbi:MAG: secretory lipase family protein [Nocardioidaceae bacterium]|nr:secretory lipase family protein [Nocardioidaceae bacterium]